MAGILREPLLHFAVFGTLVFAGFHVFGTPQASPGSGQVITYDAATLERLKQSYANVWKRPPTAEEFKNLLDADIENELLVREALALGLDRGDAVIRGRLVQKMRFLAASAAQAMAPGDDVLQAHLEAARGEFEVPARMSFVHVYLGAELPSDNGSGLLAELAAGADPAGLGVQTLLPRTMMEAAEPAVGNNFGGGFAEAVLAQEPGIWGGPVKSGYGWHLVRLDAASEPGLPPLDEVRDSVLFDWRRALAEDLTAGQIAHLRERYEVRLPDDMQPQAGEAGQ